MAYALRFDNIYGIGLGLIAEVPFFGSSDTFGDGPLSAVLKDVAKLLDNPATGLTSLKNLA